MSFSFDPRASSYGREQQKIINEYNDKKAAGKSLINNYKENPYEEIGIGHKKQDFKKDDAQDKTAFMTLFIEQLKNQNPLDPMEGADFVAQLAQFNTVEGIHRLNDKIETMAETFRSNHVLGASSLIGRKIQMPTNSVDLMSFTDDEGVSRGLNITGIMKVPDINQDVPDHEHKRITDVRLSISSTATGEHIAGMHFGEKLPNEEVKFNFDGNDDEGNRILDSNGEPIPDGNYRVTGEIQVDGRWDPIRVLIGTKIDSISVGKDNGKIMLNAAGVGEIGLDELDRVSE